MLRFNLPGTPMPEWMSVISANEARLLKHNPQLGNEEFPTHALHVFGGQLISFAPDVIKHDFIESQRDKGQPVIDLAFGEFAVVTSSTIIAKNIGTNRPQSRGEKVLMGRLHEFDDLWAFDANSINFNVGSARVRAFPRDRKGIAWSLSPSLTV